MTDIVQQHCFNHLEREAVARCPECRRFFCRECVTEHDDRVVCAACLKALAPAKRSVSPALRFLALAGSLAVSVLLIWIMFYTLGRTLLRLPSSFHEGSVWQEKPSKDGDDE